MNIKNLFDLTGKFVVVTGGTGFYGKPISEGLAEAGAHVVIASRNQQRCEDWADVLRGRGLVASSDAYDQSDDVSISSFCERVWNQFGGVDVLVNNSVSRPMTSYQDGVEAWRESMVTNGTGLFAISQVFLDRMMDRGSGSMINIGSIQGVVAPDFTNYEGTGMTTPPDYQFHKHGMVGLTKYLAAWAGPSDVRVNAISPGGLGLGGEKEPFLSQYCHRVYLGRMAKYDDIKGAVVLLASEASAYITGQNLVVDGGYSC